MMFNTRITEEGLQHLTALRQLITLHVGGVKVGAVGLHHLSQLPNLRHLGAEVDEGAVQRHLPRLARAWVSQRLVEDTDLEFVDTPLVDIVEFLSEMHEIRFHFDDAVVRRKLVQPHTSVSIDVKAISVDSALKLLLRPLELEHMVLADRVLITSSGLAASYLETETYDLSPLIAPGDDTAVAELVATIRNVVKPASWQAGDATGGSIRVDGRTLTIRQSQAAQRTIHALLEGLASRNSIPTPVQKRIRAALSKGTTLECKGSPLSGVAQYLARRRRVGIVLDPVAIKAGELDPDAPVTMAAEDLPLAKLLDDVLRPLKLTWANRDELLQITSQTQADKWLEPRIYHVGDLIIKGQTADQVATQIRKQLGFDTHADWTCSPCLNRIVVRAPLATHRQVQRFAEQLRARDRRP
jgi:hypothetical protein